MAVFLKPLSPSTKQPIGILRQPRDPQAVITAFSDARAKNHGVLSTAAPHGNDQQVRLRNAELCILLLAWLQFKTLSCLIVSVS